MQNSFKHYLRITPETLLEKGPFLLVKFYTANMRSILEQTDDTDSSKVYSSKIISPKWKKILQKNISQSTPKSSS